MELQILPTEVNALAQLHAWVESFLLPDISADHEAKTRITESFQDFKKWATSQVQEIP